MSESEKPVSATESNISELTELSNIRKRVNNSMSEMMTLNTFDSRLEDLVISSLETCHADSPEYQNTRDRLDTLVGVLTDYKKMQGEQTAFTQNLSAYLNKKFSDSKSFIDDRNSFIAKLDSLNKVKGNVLISCVQRIYNVIPDDDTSHNKAAEILFDLGAPLPVKHNKKNDMAFSSYTPGSGQAL